MSKRKYKDIRFHGKSLETIERVNAIVEEYEAQGYELDALEPKVITSLIRDEVTALRDSDLLYEIEHREETDKTNIKLISQHYERVVDFIHSEVV